MVLFLVAVLAAISLACGFNFSTANISGARLAKDAEGNNPTTTFAQEDEFYAVVDLTNAPDDTRVKVVWTVVEAGGAEPNQKIDEYELTTGSGALQFNLSNDKLWPVGKYKAEVYLNDKLDRTLDFTVEGAETAAVAEKPSPTPTSPPEPTSTPEPEPTATETESTPTKTPAPAKSAGDTLGGGGATSTTSEMPEGVLFMEEFNSAENGWPTGKNEDDYTIDDTSLAQGRYVLDVEAIKPAFVERQLPDQQFDNFYLTLEATPLDKGDTYSYGVSFRVDEDGNGYAFEIGNDGQYGVLLYNLEWSTVVDWTKSSAINVGQTNKLAVLAQDKSLSFYVNDEPLTTIEDDTVLTGVVGVVVDMFTEGESAKVAFDNLMVGDPAMADLSGSQTDTTSDVKPGSLPFEDAPYTHPSGGFTFGVPQGWELNSEDETSAAWGDDQSRVGAAFYNAGVALDQGQMEKYVSNTIGIVADSFSSNYKIEKENNKFDENGLYYVGLSFNDGKGLADVFYEQHDTVIYIIYFASLRFEKLQPTWDEILNTYQVDATAAAKASPAPAAKPVAAPTVAPEPTTPPPPPGPSVPAGKSMLQFNNNKGFDFVVDVIGPTNTSQVIPPNSSHQFVIDPGHYILNGHSPGGEYLMKAYEFDVAPGEVYRAGI
jgi:hypothetical protein